MAERGRNGFWAYARNAALLAIAGAAQAREAPRPTSSEAINITVSVAARLRLQAIEDPIAAISHDVPRLGQFCIDANFTPKPLAIMLVWPSSDSRVGPSPAAAVEQMGETVTLIGPCRSAKVGPTPSLPLSEGIGPRAVLIRPE